MTLLNQFFELLRSGLWNKPANASYFASGETNWEAIYRLAQQQTVIALVFDGIETLPETLRPSRPLYVRWCAKVAQIEAANRQLNEMVATVFDLYAKAGIRPVLLKGQGIAVHYPRPEHRQCGDIDLYIGKKQYATANRTILAAGGESDLEDQIKHAGFIFQDVHIENHRIVGTLNHPAANRRLYYLEKKYLQENPASTDIQGYTVPIPPPTFNQLYIFIHAFNHFLIGGIGLRQVCDWARMAVVNHAWIDREEMAEELNRLKLTRAASAFARIAVDYLGLPASQVPFDCVEAKKETEILLKEILLSGNFGQHDSRFGSRPPGYWRGKLFTYRRAVKRSRELRRFAPAEAAWSPVQLIKGTLLIQWYKWKKILKLSL